MGSKLKVAVLLLVLGAGCAHTPRVEGLSQKLETVPGGYITGDVSGLEREAVLDRKEMIYAVALSDDGRYAAITHLAGKDFNLTLFGLEPPIRTLASVRVNGYEYDVEGVAFSPDGETVATASRDGVVRFWSAKDGSTLGEFFTEEPLVSAAFTHDGRHVVAGSARGLLTLISWPNPAFASELRAHQDEVRAIHAAPNGPIVTGSWDKTLALFEVGQAKVSTSEVNLSVGQTVTPRPVAVVRAGLNGKMGLFAYDATVPYVVVSSELARSAGVDPSLLTETAQVMGKDARIARGQKVNLKQLTVEGVDVAVCDACLPKETHGILGAPIFERFNVTPNPVSGELVLQAKAPPDETDAPLTAALKEVGRHRFGAFINDFTVDRKGQRLGVAFSNEKAERSIELRARERKGDPPPRHADDAGAIVELSTGKVLRKWGGHLGQVASAAISPDGQTLATGGWDYTLLVHDVDKDAPVAKETFAWTLRRVRFSQDGRLIAVAAWTPPNAVGDQESDPAAVLYEVLYSEAEIVPPSN